MDPMRSPRPLPGDTVVFSHTKLPSSRQSSVVAGMGSPVSEPPQIRQRPSPNRAPPVSDLGQPPPKKLRVNHVRGERVRRVTVKVLKQGDRLGFGVRHDRFRRLKVSTLQGAVSDLEVGDTLLSVNGIDLTDLEFLTVIGHLKATRPGELVFQVEREILTTVGQQPKKNGTTGKAQQVAASTAVQSVIPVSVAASSGATQSPTGVRTGVSMSTMPPEPVSWSGLAGQAIGDRSSPAAANGAVAQQGASPIAVMPSQPGSAVNGVAVNGVRPTPKKPRKPAQRAVTMLDENGQPVNVTALMADLKKERAEKASLEEKNAGLRRKVQKMLIDNGEMRMRASNEVAAAQENAKREIAEAQNALTAIRAQLRLQDRVPDVARTDSIVNELMLCKAQLERLKNAETERTNFLNVRYRSECRIAAVDAQRVLDSFVDLFRAKLRQVGRVNGDGAVSTDIEVGCDGVRRLAFMKLFRLPHDFAFYSSAAFHTQEPVQHVVEQEQFTHLFGNALSHEERAGLFYIATAPMHVLFDPSTERVALTCQWAEQNTLRDLARNFRF